MLKYPTACMSSSLLDRQRHHRVIVRIEAFDQHCTTKNRVGVCMHLMPHNLEMPHLLFRTSTQSVGSHGM